MATDIYQIVTDRIISALEEGTVPWRKPWKESKDRRRTGTGFPCNGVTGREYNGINVVLLWLTQQERGYTSNEWFTFKQAKSLGGSVRKGEKATLITFWKQLVIKDKEDNDKTKRIPLLRYFNVFNREQIEGLPDTKPVVPIPEPERNASIEAWIEGLDVKLLHAGDRAYYYPAMDSITMPQAGSFLSMDHYYATLFHELTHWTGAEHRLGRLDNARFGTASYAEEELVAEMGSAFLCARHEVDNSDLQHPSYIAGWLKKLKEDKKFIFSTASAARQAVEFMFSEDENEEEDTEELERVAA